MAPWTRPPWARRNPSRPPAGWPVIKMGPRGLEPIAPWPVLVRWAAHRLLTGWRGRTIIPEMRSVSHQDEQIRDALTDGIKKANIDARNLSVEVVDRSVIIK